MSIKTHADAALAKMSKSFSDHLHANQPGITREQADEIFRASPYFEQLDGGDDDERGYLYFLEDGSMVLVDWSGKLTHSPD
jgi:hypothetical protein